MLSRHYLVQTASTIPGVVQGTGWDMKELMDYVGWKDVQSAMRYLDGTNQVLAARFERGLKEPAPIDQGCKVATAQEQARPPRQADAEDREIIALGVSAVLRHA